MSREHKKRSVAKALTWRVIASLVTTTIVFVITRELTLSLGAGAVDIIIKLIFYYFHERAWNRIKWGTSVLS